MQYRPELLRESDRYRGRRRVATPPRSRYAAVITTAFVGAGIVAFGAGAGITDAKTDALSGDTAALSESSSARADRRASSTMSEKLGAMRAWKARKQRWWAISGKWRLAGQNQALVIG